MALAIADLVTLTDPQDAPVAEGRDAPHVQALVDAARRGDREAFSDLVALHERIVLRTALAALRVREDAEDAAQEAFVVAWQKLPGFRGDATFRTWLLTITWRKALDKRRQRQSWWKRSGNGGAPAAADGTGVLDRLAARDPDPERAFVSQDLAAHVRQAITSLSPKLRDTLLLSATGEHSYDEIAALLGVPLGTVKWRVAQARRIVSARVPTRVDERARRP